MNDVRLAKALSHPVRMRALIALNERVASPNELAKQLDEPIGVVAYHVRRLLDLGCIRLVKTAQRRGATEHYYAATTRAIFDKGWDRLGLAARTSVSSAVLAEIWRDVGRALTEGTFDARDERHLSRTTLVLDEQAWLELNEKLIEVVDRALELQTEAAGRIADGTPEIVSKLALMHFTPPVADGAAEPPSEKPRKRTKTAASGRRSG